MSKHFIHRQVLKININYLLLSLVTLALWVFVTSGEMSLYKGMLGFAKEVKSYNEIKIGGDKKSSKELITLSSNSKFYRTDYGSYDKNGKMTDEYILLPIEDRIIVLLVPEQFLSKNANKDTLTFKGVVHHLRSVDLNEINSSMVKQGINQQKPSISSTYVINCQSKYGYDAFDPRVGLWAYIPILLFIFWRLYKLFLPKNKSRSMKVLSSFGDAEGLSESIDDEILNHVKLKMPKVIITKSWLIFKDAFKVNTIPIDKIVWSYKGVTKNHVNLVHMFNTYELNVFTSNGNEYKKMVFKKKNVDKVIEYLEKQYPWVVLGYSDELEEFWDSDCDNFIAEVEKEKSELIG